jgi:hypothetical protein
MSLLPDKISEFGWFGAGWSVFHGTTDPDYFPPLNDMEAQRQWLGGFAAAWVEHPDQDIDSLLNGGEGGQSVEQALAEALEGRAALMLQLRQHHAPHTVH